MNRLIPTAAVFAFLSATLPGQQRDLKSDLSNLNERHKTAHYVLAGTVSDAKLKHYGQALEFVYREYAKGFGDLLDRPKTKKGDEASERFKVVIIAKAAEYEEFTKAYFGTAAEHSAGLFVPSANLLVILDRPDAKDTYGTLFHEAFHQFARRHVPAIPIWLNEGLATYYGSARPLRGALVFDRPLIGYFRLVQRAVDNRKLIPLRELMDSTRQAFYDQSPVEGINTSHKSLCYAQSYTLASYLINDKEGRVHLRGYIRKLSESKTLKDARRVTRETFTDKLLNAIVKPWLAHVKRH